MSENEDKKPPPNRAAIKRFKITAPTLGQAPPPKKDDD
jgi:hypothetical protein